MTTSPNAKSRSSGKLKIGDDWNAIRIIAFTQTNPLKAIAEFVENSIDAHAKTITITHGKEHGAHYLSVKDDGDGVPRNEEGSLDFKYVATRICDSIKRRLKLDGNASGLRGEFGIGLLSSWTVGDILTMISTRADQRAYQMAMREGDSRYKVGPRRVLSGTPRNRCVQPGHFRTFDGPASGSRRTPALRLIFGRVAGRWRGVVAEARTLVAISASGAIVTRNGGTA